MIGPCGGVLAFVSWSGAGGANLPTDSMLDAAWVTGRHAVCVIWSTPSAAGAIWIACNQSDEVMVLEPTEGRLIAKLGDFGAIDEDGAPIGFLWSNGVVFHGDEVQATNLSADISALTSKSLRTVDGPWAAQVKLHTVSKIKKRIPGVSG